MRFFGQAFSFSVFLAFCFSSFILKADGGARFEENKGQWPKSVTFRADIPGGALFVEQQGFTYHFQTSNFAIHHSDNKANVEDELVKGHVLKMQFLGANAHSKSAGKNQLSSYSNYFIGKDKRNWAANVLSYSKIEHENIYPGINWIVYSNELGLKYDFQLEAGANPKLIQFQYQGADKISIKQGKLFIQTSLGTIEESAPIAWQDIDGKRVSVSCRFKLSNNIIQFETGKYNSSYPLTIDPQLVFGTFSGSSADNWGFTATYDNSGNTYSAGVVFGIGYPTTLGAYQQTFNGGAGARPCDIGIIKYDGAGQRLYASYLGGTANEIPQSLIVSSSNELFLFGTTGSNDFPTTSTAWQRTFAGGPELNILGTGVRFPGGTDLFVSRLSENGNQLLASTLLGGTGNDGINTAPQLRYNYADDARGGIAIDDQNNVYIGCSTASSDFPVPGNAFQPAFGGGVQDGMLVKFNANLSTLFWGSYLGGSSADGIMNLVLDQNGNVFVGGGTVSIDFPIVNGALQNTNGGGQSDGFIAGIRPNGQSLFASTYYGTDVYDQVYILAADRENNIYAFGQTEKGGNFYQQNFTFNENDGKQFISKFNNSLSSRIWSTSFGNGLAKPDITPSAFTVDICGQIFVSGWGGANNSTSSGLPFGGTSGLTTTSDAFQSTTDNNDFYLMVLDESNQSLVYATFFGGAQSAEHVDGGTSRFDRKGIIYQAVCAGCGGDDDFPTTPGVWSNVNGSSSGCNNAVYKFDFQLPATVASFTSKPIGCAPFNVDFSNSSSFATSYSWLINGTEFSASENPTWNFTSPGVYIIQLIASNPNSCNVLDTFTKQIRVVNSTRDVFDSLEVCYLTQSQIGPPFPVDPYYEIIWTPEAGLNDASAQQPLASPEQSTNYTLYLSLGSCADTIEQYIDVLFDTLNIGPDLTICRGQSIAIGVPGDSSLYTYAWSPELPLDSITFAMPVAQVDQTTRFYLLRIPKDSALGCPGKDSLELIIPEGSPLANFTTEVLASCTEVKVKIENSSELADSYSWNFGAGSSTGGVNPDVIYQYGDSIQITLIVSNPNCTDTLEFLQPLKDLKSYFTINDVNAFSPNGDGKNDCFSPALQNLPNPDDTNFLKCSTLRIFNRWGNLIFESIESDTGCWNGTTDSGQNCPSGTYFFLFEGQGQSLQGAIELIRD